MFPSTTPTTIKSARLIPVMIGIAALALTAAMTASATTAQEAQADLASVRGATAHFHDLTTAESAGYTLLKDAAGIACIDNPGVGAMGVHYVNGALVGSGTIDALRPQALVYEPNDDELHLVAVEYVVFQAVWDAAHTAPPTLFGQTFMLTPAGNRYGLPAFYSLHAWIWKPNPSGMFSMWNPSVSCARAETADLILPNG